MKAILIIDELPKSCYECPLTHSETGFFGDICDSVCTVLDRTNIVFMDGMGKPEWCPLKPLPQKMTMEKALKMERCGSIRDIYTTWDACLAEITGETE